MALVTGVGGQDGVYLSRYLVKQGYRVLGTVVNREKSQPLIDAYLPDVDIVELNICDTAGFERLVRDQRPHEIYNLAACNSVGKS